MKYCFALLCFIALTIPALAQQKIYIKIDGIDGESQDLPHRNWIDAYAYSGGLTNSGTTRLVGVGYAGKSSFQDYTFTICLDKSVNRLKAAAARGYRIPSVLVEFVKNNNGDTYRYSTILMENVLITSIIEGASTDISKININVSFNYAKVTCNYYFYNDKGQPVPGFIFGWDIAGNMPL